MQKKIMNTANDLSTPRLVVTIDDVNLLNKIKSAIKMVKGVSGISVLRPKKSEEDLAHEDVKAGRVTKWDSVDDLFNKVIAK